MLTEYVRLEYFSKFLAPKNCGSKKICIYLWRGIRTGKTDRAAAHEADTGRGEPAATHTQNNARRRRISALDHEHALRTGPPAGLAHSPPVTGRGEEKWQHHLPRRGGGTVTLPRPRTDGTAAHPAAPNTGLLRNCLDFPQTQFCSHVDINVRVLYVFVH